MFVLTALLGGVAVARAGGPTSMPAEHYGFDLPPDRVLPTRLSDDAIGDGNTAGPSRAVSLAPPVQAIPTPTGFQAGMVALLAATLLQLGRRVRRRLA